MKVTLVQWLELDALRKQAMEAAEELGHRMAMLAIDLSKQGDQAGSKLMLDYAERADDAKFKLSSMDTHPQSEWMGGPTSGPGSENTKSYMREPHPCGLSNRRYFSAEEVQAAKDAGLLKGGPDLTGPKTTN